MKRVERSELLDLGSYEQVRDAFRRRILDEKRRRRVALGSNMSVLFENHDTVLFQIQEMLRTERISAERAILHEIETYNELVPGDDELSATIFIEYPEREERERMLSELAGVDDDFFVEVGAERCPVVPDRRSERTDRTLAVHYVKFPLTASAVSALRGKTATVKLGVDHPRYQATAELPKDTIDALVADMEG
jgi:hypothetical protein